MDKNQVALLSLGVSLLAALTSALFSVRLLRAQAVAKPNLPWLVRVGYNEGWAARLAA
jgi:hypothetical protein